MKEKKEYKYRVYLKALIALRELIDTQYSEGGWLPPERKMEKLLDISRTTCRKIIARLIDENVINSVPRQGNWVLKKSYRCKKVGIILNNGADSPFIDDISFLSSVLDTLQENGFLAHFIQTNSIDNLLLTALSHAVNSLIWITPCNSELEQAKVIQDDGSLPLVLLFRKFPKQAEKMLDKLIYVGIDLKSIGQTDAEFFLKRGHRKIAYLGEHNNDEIFNGIVATFKKNGLKFFADQQISDLKNQDELLSALMKKYDITGIISEGGLERYEKLFKFCAALPKEKRPELLMPELFGLNKVRESYPEVKIVAFRNYNPGTRQMAKKATNMLIRHLETGEKMKSFLEPVVTLKEQ